MTAVEQLASLREVANTRAFRKALSSLRRSHGPLAAECVRRVVVIRESIPDVCCALNMHLAAQGREDRYTVDEVRAVVLQALPVAHAKWRRQYRTEDEHRS